MQVLVIEDNVGVCSMLEMFFGKEDFNGVFLHDGLEGYKHFIDNEYDMVILDWMLPSMDGITVCRKIREVDKNVPIIMLTAKDTESDQVLGLEMGADDYVTKPFSPLALTARMKAIVRRQSKEKNNLEDAIETSIIKINKETREVFISDKLISNLTPKEFDLLSFFAQHPKQVFSRDQILERVWGFQFYGDDRTVDVHIKRLRRKIGRDNQPFFHTVWGVGYKYDETVVINEN
ncbi:response regulator transcription factor [Niallia taxi]|uniref:Response regulator transcription factor n=1 Tax=Niallia taxi TaxID=2499688 RepID=A0A3S2UUK2_9BACI|nr:response regulator transcription factor [Niallia taxi]MCM3217588.1 response regulator transcription factor [Niallia taxi]MDK8642868.1 response regulator transcription factor [Niallia taxi]MED4039567.1 response regulator transcription factor [Niallia taxi]MED4054394.1 response regulator transcription factor [Niallia taxi]MED4120331.1 response regulator transcription factor [Niallia taxi]